MAGEPILVVDDNPTNLKLVCYLLSARGYAVRSAVDAPSALASLAELRPRLILLDIQLPGMDGLELARRLRADPEFDEVRIVAVTAYAMTGDAQKAADAGFDAYITKPIDTRALPERVAELLR